MSVSVPACENLTQLGEQLRVLLVEDIPEIFTYAFKMGGVSVEYSAKR